MLKDAGSIPWETLYSQDGFNLGDIRFCPLRRMLRMQRLSLNGLQKLITEGVFMPSQSEGSPELSRTTAIVLVFQADSQHQEITDAYVGLVVRRVESRLYNLDQILDFIKEIEIDLQAAHDVLNAGGDPSKRHTFCLFISNFGGALAILTDPPYCLVYPTCYVRDADLDHFDTCNNPAGTCLHHCVCHTTLQFSNDDPKEHSNYTGNDWFFPSILEPQNHHGPLIDSTMGEPYPMQMVGDFRAADLIFKGCYGDSLLYSNTDLCWLRQWRIHLPVFQVDIPVPPAPSYWQVREPTVTTQSPHRVAALATTVESPKAKYSGSKSSPRGLGCSSNLTPKCPDSTSTKKPSGSKEPTLNGQEKSPKAHSSHKCGCSPSPTAGSAGCKQRDLCTEESSAVNTTLLISSSMFDGFCSPKGSFSNVTELLPPPLL